MVVGRERSVQQFHHANVRRHVVLVAAWSSSLCLLLLLLVAVAVVVVVAVAARLSAIALSMDSFPAQLLSVDTMLLFMLQPMFRTSGSSGLFPAYLIYSVSGVLQSQRSCRTSSSAGDCSLCLCRPDLPASHGRTGEFFQQKLKSPSCELSSTEPESLALFGELLGACCIWRVSF